MSHGLKVVDIRRAAAALRGSEHEPRYIPASAVLDRHLRRIRLFVRVCGVCSAVAFAILAFMYGRLMWLN